MSLSYGEMKAYDFELADDLQDVTLTDPLDPANSKTGIKARGLGEEIRVIEFAEGLAKEAMAQEWEISVLSLSTYVPEPGHSLTDSDGIVWTIVSVRHRTLSNYVYNYVVQSYKQI